MKKIYINPGHSDTDPGAVGFETERKLNVAVAYYMNEYLQEQYECLTRWNPGTVDKLADIVADANSWGADLFVSCHFNAGGGDGYEALVYSEKRLPLGRIFEKHVLAAGQNSRGVKLRTDLSVLKYTNMPAVLNEGAFVDNSQDIRQWSSTAQLQLLGQAYAKAAAEYLGLPRKDGAKLVLPMLAKGTLGAEVTALQRLLGITADGDFGSQTREAVEDYQRNLGLVVDGIVGAQTWGSLLAVGGGL